ncbi:hypothetical protein A606_04835 [Corynebacterium terpenotabidum Y-11]|uniref:Uncharacterized protein n=1 Tax=Corynebacterium terpenotabidum Y-11 TaxID=1200352 RepID=S4XDI7_9CORY|nr:hypothetical protein A606_04835 [Corynebacterium terpenotabidum Y-11]
MAGILLTATLALAACGSDDDGEAASSTTASSAASSSAAPGSGEASASAATGENGAPADQATIAAGEPAASEGGETSAEDATQITDLTKGLNGDMTMADYMQYNLDHQCSAYIDSRGGRDSIQSDIDAMRQENQMVSDLGLVYNITDVTDIRVSGDNATATVSGTVGDQASTETVTYLRENGAWTICPVQ